NEHDFYNLSLKNVDYVIVSGGDGLLRRVIEYIIFSGQHKPKIIIDAQGSFNVIAKRYLIPKVNKVLIKIEKNEPLQTKAHDVYKLNEYVFLFSAGNMFDALHIHLSEILRIGFLSKGPLKYFISMILLLPVIILSTPFLIFSKKRFFIFTPVKGFNFLNFYSKINELKIDLKNGYNLIEIDGDLVILKDNLIDIKHLDTIDIVYK
ncbi:MAG TPA: hypothetical protein ENK64_03125, partial [Flavobacteriales bacterium]|nr:hypothetical protein [Flavobacteriales bacterium]